MVASTEVTSIWRRRDIEKSTWRTHRYFIDFESGIHVEFSTLNRCHNFHVDLPFKIDEISTNFPRGISTWNRWRIDEDVSIGGFKFTSPGAIMKASVQWFLWKKVTKNTKSDTRHHQKEVPYFMWFKNIGSICYKGTFNKHKNIFKMLPSFNLPVQSQQWKY